MKTFWLHDPGARDPLLVGERVACLSSLTDRYPVPAGFCLVATAPEEGALPPAVVTSLVVAYNQLAKRSGSTAPDVSLRAFGVGEGGEAVPEIFIPHVSGWEAVVEAAGRCLLSTSPRRLEKGLHRLDQHQVAVMIQQYVPPDISGLGFSINPLTGSREEVLINATWGLGTKLTAGSDLADQYRASKSRRSLLEQRVGVKRQMILGAPGTTFEAAVPRLMQTEFTMKAEQVEEISRLLITLEAELKHPVAVEFAFAGDQLRLLQCRPVGADVLGSRTEVAAALSEGQNETPLVAPPEFPVEWEEPADVQRYWVHAAKRHPDPVLPMMAGFLAGPWATAWERENPRSRYQFRRINTYLYRCHDPNPEPPPPEEEPLWAAGQLQSLWERKILPELQTQYLQLVNSDLTTAPDHALLSQWEELLERFILIWELHWRMVGPVRVTLERFREIYGELFAPADPLEHRNLLEGFDHRWLEANQELWRLSREVLVRPPLRDLFLERRAEELKKALPSSQAGEGWLRQLNLYLDRYGRRFEGGDWSRPSWREDLTPALRMVQRFLTEFGEVPAESAARLAAEREAAEEAAMERLELYPQPVRERFRDSLRAAQTAAVLQQEYDFWIDHWGMYEVRRVIRSLGRRLVDDGLMEAADEIWYLRLDEVREVLSGGPAADLRSRVARRREEMARWAKVTPPPALGRRPAAAGDLD